MTTYIFKPKSSTQSVNWDDRTVWSGGVVPNSPDADVDFPLTTDLLTGSPYASFVSIGAPESFSVRSVQIQDNFLEINGHLDISNSLSILQGGEIDLSGTMSAATIDNNGSDIQGFGSISAGTITNRSGIVGNGLSIQANSFTNTGSLQAVDGDLTVNVSPGGFTNLSGSTLTGGSYSATNLFPFLSTLSFKVGDVISSDAANITLHGGGTIQSYDDASGQYVPLTSSLHTIAPSGLLTLQASSYAFGPLTVSGRLALGGDNSDVHLASSQLTVAAGGNISGTGTVDSPIDNEGVIESSGMILNGAVFGAGTLEIDPFSQLELNGPTSQKVMFDNNAGVMQIDTPSTFTGNIAPSGVGDKIILSNTSISSITGTSYSGDSSGGTLTLQEAGGSIPLSFIGNYDATRFSLSAGPQRLSSDPPSVLITVDGPVCFAAGTLIRTVKDDVAVEALKIGDMVVTASGAQRPVRWVGHRAFDCRTHSDPFAVYPIRISANAFGPGKPARDLYVSPGHSVCLTVVEEVLIPASALVNGATVAHVDVDEVTYWHVELDSHDVILAENLPTESYLEMSNRGFFVEEGVVALDARPDTSPRTHADFCRPYHDAGPLVDAVRVQLGVRALALGWALDEAPYADLHLVADGTRIEADVDGFAARFVVPATAKDVWLVSNTSVPRHVGLSNDMRHLGVYLTGVKIDDGLGDPRAIALDDPRLSIGFHMVEGTGAETRRWTGGCARLPSTLWDGCRGHLFLRVDLFGAAIPRWIAPGARRNPRLMHSNLTG